MSNRQQSSASAPTSEQISCAREPAWTPSAPVLKWAGGKRWILPLIGAGIRVRLLRTGGRYIEPFLGGGAVGLYLGAPGMILGDVEPGLIGFYKAMARDPDRLHRALRRLIARGVDERAYLAVRAANPRTESARAARFLYLNKLGFNGLHRVNSRGEFNVPYGAHRGPPQLPSADELSRAAAALAGAALHAGDFEALVAHAGNGDVVFADPPYHGAKGFRSYSARRFDDADQARLSAALQAAAARGAAVVTTNADTPEVRRWYAWAHVVPTGERRAINARGAGRGAVACILATSAPTMLGG